MKTQKALMQDIAMRSYEDEILDTGVAYTHIANESIHGDRLIMNKPHEKHYFDWLVSRGEHPEQNCICV